VIVTALAVLGLGGVLLLALDLFAEGFTPLLRAVALLVMGAAAALLLAGRGIPSFAAAVLNDDALARLLGALAAMAGALAALLPLPVADAADRNQRAAGYLALLAWTSAGMVLLAAAGDLLTLFLGLELLSLGLYALTAYAVAGPGGEAAMKYFLLGGLGSGLLLYGGALVFAGTGRLDFLTTAVPAVGPLAKAGLALLLAGLGFKLALVPFHLWTPDVYEGAPTAVTAFMAVGSKAAAFAAAAHLLLRGFPGAEGVWAPLLGAVAVASLLVGYALAAPQQGVKRLLAYSSIANAGTAALALLLGPQGPGILVLYLYAYAAATFGAFACLDATGGDVAGLGRRRPFLGGTLLLFLLSLASVPLTAGFAGKLVLLLGLVRGGRALLAVLVVASTVIALYPYFKVARLLTGPGERRRGRTPAGAAAVVAACALATLALGVWPGLLPGA
jgi:NADH-quinone oxidoreductase subunit N